MTPVFLRFLGSLFYFERFNRLQPDSEYPDWLWGLLDTRLTREELLREAESHFANGGYDEVLDKMDEKKLVRLFRLDSRARIKENNSMGGLS